MRDGAELPLYGPYRPLQGHIGAQPHSDLGSALYVALLRLRGQSEYAGLRDLCRRLGLAEGDAASMSRVMRGETIGTATARRLARALGLLPPPRRVGHRVVMDDELFALWQALTPAERLARLK